MQVVHTPSNNYNLAELRIYILVNTYLLLSTANSWERNIHYVLQTIQVNVPYYFEHSFEFHEIDNNQRIHSNRTIYLPAQPCK